MKTTFANSDDIMAYIDKRNLVRVKFGKCLWHWRDVELIFDDETSVSLQLEDCREYKFWKWTWYDGVVKVKYVHFSQPNYTIILKNNDFRNFLIEGITLEEKRLENAWSEGFTNVVRDEKNKIYHFKTILNGVEFKERD